MQPTTIYKHTNGEWVTDFKTHVHKVFFDESDGSDFISLGLGNSAVRFEVTSKGVILGVFEHITGNALTEVTIPAKHPLRLAINIGKPV